MQNWIHHKLAGGKTFFAVTIADHGD